MPHLLDKRIVYVTGKGGVGKSTLSAVLGLLAARAGRRTIVAELGGQDRLARTFGVGGRASEERRLTQGLWTVSVDPMDAMREYLRAMLPSGALAGLLGSSRIFNHLATAAPGLREMAVVGMLWDLAQPRRHTPGDPYDLVVVDAYSSGHAVGLLRTPRMFTEIAGIGPIARQATQIHKTLVDPGRTAVVAVTQPEEMPVTETLELAGDLRRELRISLAAVLVNAVYPERFTATDRRTLRRALQHDGTPLARGAMRASLAAATWAANQREQLDRLESDGLPPGLRLPFLFAAELDRGALEHLADLLGAEIS